MNKVQIADFANNAHKAYLGRVRAYEEQQKHEGEERRLWLQAVFFGVILVIGMLIVGWCEGNL